MSLKLCGLIFSQGNVELLGFKCLQQDSFVEDCAALGLVFCAMKHSGQSEDMRVALPKMVGIDYIIQSLSSSSRKRKGS